MAKAILLIIGAATYLWITQLGQDTAQSGLAQLQLLYTTAGAQAAAVSAASNSSAPAGATALAK